MPVVHLPRSLVALFPDAPRRLEVPGTDLADVLRGLDARYPGMWDRLCEPGPRLRPHINAYVDGRPAAIDAPVGPSSVVHVIPAVSGGSDDDGELVEGTAPDGRRYVQPVDRAAWRRWLAAHHARPDGVWLATWKARTGRPRLLYEDIVEEALCFGWVDSKSGSLDDERGLIWMSPRRAGSAWSRPNKLRVERLEAAGLMTDAGRRPIEAARADGTWTLLDEVEDLVVPHDLAAAFGTLPGSRETWESFPRSVRRANLEWIVQAKRPATRADRVARVAELAARGERAGQWARPTVTVPPADAPSD